MSDEIYVRIKRILYFEQKSVQSFIKAVETDCRRWLSVRWGVTMYQRGPAFPQEVLERVHWRGNALSLSTHFLNRQIMHPGQLQKKCGNNKLEWWELLVWKYLTYLAAPLLPIITKGWKIKQIVRFLRVCAFFSWLFRQDFMFGVVRWVHRAYSHNDVGHFHEACLRLSWRHWKSHNPNKLWRLCLRQIWS